MVHYVYQHPMISFVVTYLIFVALVHLVLYFSNKDRTDMKELSGSYSCCGCMVLSLIFLCILCFRTCN